MIQDRHWMLVLRETALSAGVNMFLSGLFFVAFVGTRSDVRVGGIGGLSADFLPQALGIGFMGSLVPGLVVRRRVRAGVGPVDTALESRPLLVRAVLAALLAAALAGGSAAVLLLLLGPPTMDLAPALTVKLAFGGLVAAFVTPPAVWGALRQPRMPVAA